jgi:hypothetical protein
MISLADVKILFIAPLKSLFGEPKPPHMAELLLDKLPVDTAVAALGVAAMALSDTHRGKTFPSFGDCKRAIERASAESLAASAARGGLVESDWDEKDAIKSFCYGQMGRQAVAQGWGAALVGFVREAQRLPESRAEIDRLRFVASHVDEVALQIQKVAANEEVTKWGIAVLAARERIIAMILDPSLLADYQPRLSAASLGKTLHPIRKARVLTKKERAQIQWQRDNLPWTGKPPIPRFPKRPPPPKPSFTAKAMIHENSKAQAAAQQEAAHPERFEPIHTGPIP